MYSETEYYVFIISIMRLLVWKNYGAQNETYIEDERPKRNEVV